MQASGQSFFIFNITARKFAWGKSYQNNRETIQSSIPVILQFRVEPWEQTRETLRADSTAGQTQVQWISAGSGNERGGKNNSIKKNDKLNFTKQWSETQDWEIISNPKNVARYKKWHMCPWIFTHLVDKQKCDHMKGVKVKSKCKYKLYCIYYMLFIQLLTGGQIEHLIKFWVWDQQVLARVVSSPKLETFSLRQSGSFLLY